MKYRLIPKYKKMLEVAASLSSTSSAPLDPLEQETPIQMKEISSIDDITEFNSPKEAIRWCNDKFRELGDRKYKQIANYLHIYM